MSRIARIGRLSLYTSTNARIGFYRHRRPSGQIEKKVDTGLPPEVEKMLGVGTVLVPGPERLIFSALRLGWMEIRWRPRGP